MDTAIYGRTSTYSYKRLFRRVCKCLHRCLQSGKSCGLWPVSPGCAWNQEVFIGIVPGKPCVEVSTPTQLWTRWVPEMDLRLLLKLHRERGVNKMTPKIDVKHRVLICKLCEKEITDEYDYIRTKRGTEIFIHKNKSCQKKWIRLGLSRKAGSPDNLSYYR